MYLTGLSVPVFPPSDMLRDIAERVGLIKPKITTLQMAKKLETALNEELLYVLYSHLYALAHDEEGQKAVIKKRGSKKK